jgi:hypothetical protein
MSDAWRAIMRVSIVGFGIASYLALYQP